ncbi:MAG: flagellar basal body L-ring protein FlgH [Pseudomonadota bacterium]
MTRILAVAALAALGLSACTRLEQVGQAPGFSQPGQPQQAIPAPAPQRVALAVPRRPPLPEDHSAASLWRSGPESLFGDRRARVLGDILTVVIEIDDQASISNATARARSGSEALNVPALLGLPHAVGTVLPEGASLDPAVSIGSSSSSSGDGSVRRNEEITLRVAATVVDVLPNGHLVIAGSQELRVNFELRDLQVAGIVRPEDISRRNEITYDKIAEARVAYGGRGQITDVQQPRYGQQVADIVLPF